MVAVGSTAGENGSVDLTQITQAVHAIGNALTSPLTLAIKSTVPVGSTDYFAAPS
ncbi:MAG: hypothetical protein R3C68_01350 [Myxococcota bacterium]